CRAERLDQPRGHEPSIYRQLVRAGAASGWTDRAARAYFPLGALLFAFRGCGPRVDHAAATGGDPRASSRPSGTSRASEGTARKSPRAAGVQVACAADDGAPPSCARLSDAACLGASLARRACETAGPLLLPSVAERWITCLAAPAAGGMARANPDAACDSSRILPCGFRAAESACVDGSFRDLCGKLSEDCADVAPEITPRRCEQLLAAFRPAARPKMIDCLKQGCGSGSFGVCLP
ncbi:MAG TPA: hypothetical protein VF395_07035, partial [Polyangiaceae bacterium]